MIDQHKEDSARLTSRLSGTEKQRDDALEALVLQQEIAEELERERKKNKKELSSLQQTNKNVIRQREEAQRVVVHLRSLISGQTHHMEHIVRSLSISPEDLPEDEDDVPDSDARSVAGSERSYSRASKRLSASRSLASIRRVSQQRNINERSFSPAGSHDGEKVTPEMERRFFGSPAGNKSKRLSEVSLIDVADRHLRDKTDAIAHIIRSISDQCAAAVEGLQLAHNAEQEAEIAEESAESASLNGASGDGQGSEMGETAQSSEGGFDEGSSAVTPELTTRSSIPPTPDLYHHRASTAMSINTISTANERGSREFHSPAIVTKVAEGEDEGESGGVVDQDTPAAPKVMLGQNGLRPLTSRMVQ